MSYNLVETAKNYFNNEFILQQAAQLNEKVSGVGMALNMAIPMALVNLITGVQAGPGNFIHIIKEGAGNYNPPTLLGELFGHRLSTASQTLAGYAGISQPAATQVLTAASTAAVTAAHDYATAQRLDATGITSWLTQEKAGALQALPAELRIMAPPEPVPYIPPVKPVTVTDETGSSTEAIEETVYEEEEPKKKIAVWVPVTLLVIVVGLAWYFLNSKKPAPQVVTPPPADSTKTVLPAAPVLSGALDSATGEYVYNTGKLITISLPNDGGTITAGENSTEAALCRFLQDSSQPLDSAHGNWFNFTGVRFAKGGKQITDSSRVQLNNLAMIMKAFSHARFKIGGYTDNTGDSAKNVLLSQDRAETVTMQLLKAGVEPPQITGVTGYGPLYPAGDNTTPEGRAMNRRIAVNVKAK
ncbi:Outer membrane protein OmpA [Filimonas lacunae]|uniref:Outer membrane protein OmpA n=1 Tax=Filimonas lacunae TaxID=477680 RepID=A0A173MJY4_9BACT|nr:OmpA family protein [Filimonas lacunae]BAV07787.1 major porin and structural outer membrane porin OprF [Filimonas lacunae]SIT04768.1 Outer membrane protein OmpA [Filimonas lacunae]